MQHLAVVCYRLKGSEEEEELEEEKDRRLIARIWQRFMLPMAKPLCGHSVALLIALTNVFLLAWSMGNKGAGTWAEGSNGT